jgi:hypothetical protein
MVYAIQSVGADLRSDRLTVEEALSAWKSQLHSRYEPSDVEELTRAIEVSEVENGRGFDRGAIQRERLLSFR